MSFTQQDFLKRLEELHMECVEISRRKNADYAGEKPFANFTAVETFGVDTLDGFITRMTDKLMRISNLTKREAQVKDESIKDTLLDLSNYALIMRVYLESREQSDTN